jgi:hypothetical protein
VIFVVDSSDKDRIAGDSRSAAGELGSLLEEPELKGVPLLVLANKTDLPGGKTHTQSSIKQNLLFPNSLMMIGMAVPEVSEKLGLGSLQGRKWHIQGTIATTGTALFSLHLSVSSCLSVGICCLLIVSELQL